MFTIAPFFGDWFLPVQMKILLVIFLGWISLPIVTESIALNTPFLQIVLALFNNYTFGLAIGFLALLPVVAMSVSGEIFGTQMALPYLLFLTLKEKKCHYTENFCTY